VDTLANVMAAIHSNVVIYLVEIALNAQQLIVLALMAGNAKLVISVPNNKYISIHIFCYLFLKGNKFSRDHNNWK